jgi:NADPH-dependent 2,4-dienoyl-CoA reductase/sulfur reductase-like enzyme
MRVTKSGVSTSIPDTSFRFEGDVVVARRGESVAAALINARHYGCRDSETTGQRGVFCGMGVCSECAVSIDGASGLLACMEKVVPDMRVSRNPSRKQLSEASDASPLPEEEVITEVLVIGAGPGGLRAALAAARCGARVVIVDERSAPGGQFFKQPVSTLTVEHKKLDHQYQMGRVLLASVVAAGVEVRRGTRVWGAIGPHEIYAVSDDRRLTLRTERLVIAAGAFERGVPFPGWTTPGVMTSGAAQTLLRSYLVAAGTRVLVSGNGPLNLQVAAELTTAGVEVVAVCESAPLWRASNARHLAGMMSAAPGYFREGLSYVNVLARSRVPILSRSAVIEVRGDEHAEVAVVARLDAAGRPVPNTSRSFDVDAVCLGYGFVPSSELARSLGCSHHVDPTTAALVVDRDPTGQTSIEGVWVVGDGGGIAGAQVAQAMGTLAGFDAACSLGHVAGQTAQGDRRTNEKALRRHQRFQRSLWRQFAAPSLRDQLATPETIICRCEEVTLAQLTSRVEPWLAAAGSLKRVTRAGMGKCQGRYCSPLLSELAARESGIAPNEYSGFVAQSPYLPVAVAALADSSAHSSSDRSKDVGRDHV